MDEFLILKTADGTVHRGWLVWLDRSEVGMMYSLQTSEGKRTLSVPHGQIVYAELLEKGHKRIPDMGEQ